MDTFSNQTVYDFESNQTSEYHPISFCGGRNRTRIRPNQSIFSNECFVDGINCLPHILLILAVIPVLIVLNKSYYGGSSSATWVHYPLHRLRWILTFILMLVNLCEISEGILQDNYGTHLHLFLPDILSMTAAGFAIAYYHNVEQWNSPRFLLLLFFYWLGAIFVKSARVAHLIWMESDIHTARNILTYAVLALYLALLIVETYVWIQLVSVFCRIHNSVPFEIVIDKIKVANFYGGLLHVPYRH